MLIGLAANGRADPKLPRWASILAHLDGKVNLKARENDKSFSLSLAPHSLSCIHEAPSAKPFSNPNLFSERNRLRSFSGGKKAPIQEPLCLVTY